MRSDVAPTVALYLTVNWRFELAPNRGVKVFVQQALSGIINTLPSAREQEVKPQLSLGFLVSSRCYPPICCLFQNGLTAIMPRKNKKRKPYFGASSLLIPGEVI